MLSRTILHYQLLEKLGEGGMGEVYKAQDGRLNRFVAIKLLPQSKSGDPTRRRRFIREAQAASALNHPNIITIHDIVSDSESDAEYMVMEYIGGKTLIDVIPTGGLPVQQALQYAVQIGDALSAAHAAGIVHRDLKPANVMVTVTGLVKILDFGLAKSAESGLINQSAETQSVGGEATLTVEGSILGTLNYMSPEQAQGKQVDSRSDIFSFGALLYEMLTGRRAFDGDSGLHTLTAILRDEVKPMEEVAPEVPVQLDQIVSRCLRKNPDERWQTMQEVKSELSLLKQQSASGVLYQSQLTIPPPKRGASKPMIAGVVAAVVLAAAVAGGWWWMGRRNQPPKLAPPPPVATVPAPAPSPQPVSSNANGDSVVSNDSVIEMVQAKVPVPIILTHIRGAKTKFDLSTGELIRLTKAGVPQSVVEVMHKPKAPAAAPVVKTSAPPSVATTAPAPVETLAATRPEPPIVPTPAATPTMTVTVNDASPLPITLAEDIPADAKEGRELRFTAAADFRGGGAVIITKGATISGVIAGTAKKRFLGKAGRITYRLETVDSVGGHKLKLRATPSRRGEDAGSRPVDSGKGAKSKDLAAARGTKYIAYIDGDQKVAIPK